MEWGCMQALIDFDGWRKWKDFSQQDKDEASKTAKVPGKSGTSAMSKREKRVSGGSGTLSGATSESLDGARDGAKPIAAGA